MTVRICRSLLLALGSLLPFATATVSTTAANAAVLPPGFVETQIASGLKQPTAIAVAPDGRVFVAEKKGLLRIIKDDALLPAPFLRVTVFFNGERGLLGVAFDPDFAHNGYVYVYYTATRPTAHNRISRFTANPTNPDVAAQGSEKILLDLPTLVTEYHNSGTLRFGPDGRLYASTGENAVTANSQSLATPLGKILRLNRDGSIPTDNPFYGQTQGTARAIWALGFRNPFSFIFSRETGRMFVNDVGEHTWEEIDEVLPGANFGWPTVEGTSNNSAFRDPFFAYLHGDGDDEGCAITGGAFYDSASQVFPAAYRGTYFFSDYCNGWIRRIDPATAKVTPFASGIEFPVGLTAAADGSLYYLTHQTGAVYQVRYTGSQAPAIDVQPADLTAARGETPTFSVQGSGPALTYRWRRNGTFLPGATAAAYTLPPVTLADDGARFSVVVKNGAGTATSRTAVLRVIDGHRPVVTIVAPSSGAFYSAGDTITFRGGATDAEDGTLPPAALSWRVDFHHDAHLHPFVPETSGLAQGTVTLPTRGETAPHVWYRFHLSARDSTGLVAETFVDVLPHLAQLTVATDPPGLQVTLDGTVQPSPLTVTGVVGIVRSLGVLSPQTVGADRYQFVSWSDGGEATHDVETPAVDTAWTATFRKLTTAAGSGLTAAYFPRPDLTGTPFVRRDPAVNFNWGTGSPAPGIGVDRWSARWTGQLEPAVGGPHTFFVRNDGARLWIDNVLVVDDWAEHPAAVRQGTIDLVAGRRYAVRLEYRDLAGEAGVRLLWSAPGLPREVVPTRQLFP
jgi:glucose/arabinose dehydrogenase